MDKCGAITDCGALSRLKKWVQPGRKREIFFFFHICTASTLYHVMWSNRVVDRSCKFVYNIFHTSLLLSCQIQFTVLATSAFAHLFFSHTLFSRVSSVLEQKMTKPICPPGRVMTPRMCMREQEMKNRQQHPLFHYLSLTPQTDRSNCPITAPRVPVPANSLTWSSLLIPWYLCGLAGHSVIATFLFLALTGHIKHYIRVVLFSSIFLCVEEKQNLTSSSRGVAESKISAGYNHFMIL